MFPRNGYARIGGRAASSLSWVAALAVTATVLSAVCLGLAVWSLTPSNPSIPSTRDVLDHIGVDGPLSAERSGNTLVISSSFQPCPVNTCQPSRRTCTRVECIQISEQDTACVETPLDGCTPRALMPYEVCTVEGLCTIDGSATDWQFITHRPQTDPTDVMNYMYQIVRAYVANDTGVKLSIPNQDWTGNTIIRTLENMPTIMVQPALMDGSELAQTLQGLALQLYRSMDHLMRAFDGENNAEQAGVSVSDARMPDTLDECIQLFDYVLSLTENITSEATLAGRPADFNAIIGMRIVVNLFITLRDWALNPSVLNLMQGFPEMYISSRHVGLNFEHAFAYQGGGDPQMGFGTQGFWLCDLVHVWPRAYDPAEFFNPIVVERLKLCPEVIRKSADVQRLRADQEEQQLGQTFYTRYFYDNTYSSKIFNDETDPEGVPAQPDQKISWQEIDTQAWVVPYLEPVDGQSDNSMFANFTLLNVTSNDGSNTVAYIGTDDNNANFFSIPDFLHATTMDPTEADDLIKKMAYVWDHYMVPQNRRYGAALRARISPENLIDDHYTGRWRDHLQYVTTVNRDPDTQLVVSIVTPVDPYGSMGLGSAAGPNMTVPLNASLNDEYAAEQADDLGLSADDLVALFEQVQAGIADMELWITQNLEVATYSHVGDEYLVLKRFNNSFGYYAGAVPYSSVRQITLNYRADRRIVQPYGTPGDLPDTVFEAGSSLVSLFQDVKSFLANNLIKENYQVFNFSSSSAAGLNRLNSNGVNVTLKYATDYASKVASADGAVSDVEFLGRHYGFNADGSINASEPCGSDPTYCVPPPFTCYQYYNFDYIYRQHYATDTSAPYTPDNVRDPVTGLYKYRYTNDGDEARRDDFDNLWRLHETYSNGQMQRGRCGTFMRWRYDWILQKMSVWTCRHLVQLGLADAQFAHDYYETTCIDTNDPSTLVGTGPGFGGVRSVKRFLAQFSGSANSGSQVDFRHSTVNDTVRDTTTLPFRILGDLGTMIHEGTLGHGFAAIVPLADELRGTQNVGGWAGNLVTNSLNDDSDGMYILTVPTPGEGAIFEGWATLAEILAAELGLYFKFTADGQVDTSSQDNAAALYAIINLSRIAARQVTAVGYLYSRHAWSFNRALTTFKALTGFSTHDSVDFMDRFLHGTTQQTSYAAGFTVNIGIISFLTDYLQQHNQTFDLGKFIQLRIQQTPFVLGGTLIELAQQNAFQFSTGP